MATGTAADRIERWLAEGPNTVAGTVVGADIRTLIQTARAAADVRVAVEAHRNWESNSVEVRLPNGSWVDVADLLNPEFNTAAFRERAGL